MSQLILPRRLSQQEVKASNQMFLNDVKSGDPTRVKEAGTQLNDHLITKVLREDGIFRRAISVLPISNTELDFDPYNPDLPVKYEPVEHLVDSYLVHSSDWLQPSRDLWYHSEFFKIKFYPMTSRRIKMDDAQLLASKYPVRQLVEGIVKNDFLAVEDFQFIDQIERCCMVTGNVYASANTYFKKEDFMNLGKIFSKKRLQMVQVMINEATLYDIFNWDQSEVGSIAINNILEKGVMGDDARFKGYFGIKWLVTNNPDVIPEKVIYATVPQNMLGAFYELQAPETTVEYRDGLVSIQSRQILGRGIANINGVAKIVLT